jgi:hypothetical protein
MAFAADYVQVHERIESFFARYPDGSIEADPPVVVTIGDKTFLSVTARVFRTPDDPRPAQASAWEPFPGATAFTRDSEAMNCETSAVGRAIAFLGFDVKRSVATREDVQARQPAKKAAVKKPAVKPGELSRGDAKAHLKQMVGDAAAELWPAAWNERDGFTVAELNTLAGSLEG